MKRVKCFLFTAILVSALVATGWACNIPVFRYALERWQPDVLHATVFHRGAISADERRQIEQLQLHAAGSSKANWELQMADVDSPLAPPISDLWARVQKQADLEKPYLVVQGEHLRGPFTCWAGALEDASNAGLTHSPAREQLGKRLLAGHAIVWLVVRSRDAAKNDSLLALLNRQCAKLEQAIQLPDGIGLPGSELFSEVPLLLKYSVLEIDRENPQEQFLVRLAQGFQPEAFEEDEPLVLPVFGRGRALEVIPANQLNDRLVEDLTTFLCGACSCQVKEQNPGFDLLLSVDWDRELFGENGPRPKPAASPGNGRGGPPVLLTIPPGKKG